MIADGEPLKKANIPPFLAFISTIKHCGAAIFSAICHGC